MQHPDTGTNTPPSVLSQYLTRKQLAAELGVTVRTISRWRWERKGPAAHIIGGRVYFKRSDVEAWLEKQREDAA